MCVQGIRDLRFPAYYLQRLLKIETNVLMIQIELRALPGVIWRIMAVLVSIVSYYTGGHDKIVLVIW